MSPASIEPDAFEDDAQLHYKCGFHVQMIYYVSSVIAVIVDLFPIVLGLFAFMYPELHRKTAVYPQFFQYYDRTHAHQYYIFYNVVTFVWILLFFLHILGIGIAIFGVRLKKPMLMLPQLLLLVIRIGLLLFLFCSLVCFNAVGSAFCSVVNTVVAYLIPTVLCFRFVLEKYEMIQRILASAKTVHFKDRKRKLYTMAIPLRYLPFPRIHAGDLVFFRRLLNNQQNTSSFETAIIDVAVIDSDVYHVGMIVNEEKIVHSIPDRGVILQPLEQAIEQLHPDVVEVGKMDVTIEHKMKALSFAMNEVDHAEYNDLFTSDCLNSQNRRSFYCCQLVVFAYTAAFSLPSPFLNHQLNFKDKTGKIAEFWIDYYRKRNRDVPQDQSGSHPSKLRASPCVKLSALRYFSQSMGKLSVPKNFLQTLHFIGGAYSAAGSLKPFKVYEPRSGKQLSEIKPASRNEVNEIAQLAKKAQHQWAQTSWQERGDVLRKAARLIRKNVDVLSEWEVRDNGKPITEAIADVLSCAETFEFFSNVDVSGQHLPYSSRSHEYAYTCREPFGVVGAIGAWNYPIQTATWKIAPALICGNAVIYKPSPLAPISSVLLGQILSLAGVPDGLVNIVQGEAETGTAICECEEIRKISFTGSVSTGKQIAQRAATHFVKPVTLELGGKSACIVFEDADLEIAVNGAMMANFYSQGQVCSNASKVLVHESLLQPFVELLVKKVKAMKIGDPFDKSVHVGASISKEHLEKVLGYVKDAVGSGSELLCGGEDVKVDGLENGYFMSPAVLGNVPNTSRAYKEEIFGAVLLVVPFRDDETALEIANETEFGLAAGIFTNDLRKATSFSSRLMAGNVYVNTFNNTSPFVPFGGIKQSGYGRENGKAAIENYSQIKSVFINASGKLDDPFPSTQ
ncbi:Betaine-aldehyde dehydrogenase family protein [Aphelenchoides besseyi]|nr:Betaine-aldehyde dehydrogenase family protein [Aphelenchoides besseyi]